MNVFVFSQHRRKVDPIKAHENLNGSKTISAIPRWGVQINGSDFVGDTLSPATNVAAGWVPGPAGPEEEKPLQNQNQNSLIVI